jgi:hypothetical protein
LFERDFLFLERLFEVEALNMLHGEIGAALKIRYFVNMDDIGMAQPGGRLGLTPKTTPAGLILTQVSRQELQGYLAVQLFILSQIDFAHATGTNLGNDLVV